MGNFHPKTSSSLGGASRHIHAGGPDQSEVSTGVLVATPVVFCVSLSAHQETIACFTSFSQ